MPTGYTSYLTGEKELSFEEFTMQCARSFGACMSLRDSNDEIPEKFESSTWHVDGLKKAKWELKEFKKLTESQVGKKAEEKFNEDLEHYEEGIKKDTFIKNRYESMLVKVKAWTPPTSDHSGLKTFMIKQISESIDFDIYSRDIPQKITGKEWYNNKLKSILRDIEYHGKQDIEETSRVAGRNNWTKALRESLK